MTSKYFVAIEDERMSKNPLYAIDATGEGWTDMPGQVGGLTEAEKDALVAIILQHGIAYDVVEEQRAVNPCIRRRIAGTVEIIRTVF